MLAGQSGGQQQSSKDAWVVKTDGNGAMEWNRTYGGAQYDWFTSLVQTVDGGYAIAGITSSYGAGGNDFWMVKIDVELGLIWNKSTADTITLCRKTADPYWNYVRVRIWKVKDTP